MSQVIGQPQGDIGFDDIAIRHLAFKGVKHTLKDKFADGFSPLPRLEKAPTFLDRADQDLSRGLDGHIMPEDIEGKNGGVFDQPPQLTINIKDMTQMMVFVHSVGRVRYLEMLRERPDDLVGHCRRQDDIVVLHHRDELGFGATAIKGQERHGQGQNCNRAGD